MAAKLGAKSFPAVLTRTGNSLNWVVIRLPFDAKAIWGERGQIRVKGSINNFAFRATLFPTGDGHHYMIVNKQMQKGGGVQPGMEARFRMEPDLEERAVQVSPELEHALKQSRRLLKFYQSLSPSMRTDISRFIAGAKQKETRLRRAEQAAERLMETLEAETDLPPIIRQVFLRNPQAAEGWQRMPPAHRRMHLLGIFYYRNLESRLRRIEKAVVEMTEYAKSKTSL
jgi:uncharacterized protein YdeI (YjbR/CyaY-like superfamily)